MAAFFDTYKTDEKHNRLKDNTLREALKISFFASIFPEASKYSILRASASHDFNT